MEWASIIIAIASAIFSVITYVTTVLFERIKITIEAISLLQNEVLDKFVCVKADNAKLIVENLDNDKCREAYNDYRALIARLEHFAIGVHRHIYAFGIVNNLVGIHFISLYKKIMPIIVEANKNEERIVHYRYFVKLVKKLDRKHKLLDNGRNLNYGSI